MIGQDGLPPSRAAGAFNTLTRVQADRRRVLRDRLRRQRGLFEEQVAAIAPDPNHTTDNDGAPYWGSNQHLTELGLGLIERFLDTSRS